MLKKKSLFSKVFSDILKKTEFWSKILQNTFEKKLFLFKKMEITLVCRKKPKKTQKNHVGSLCSTEKKALKTTNFHFFSLFFHFFWDSVKKKFEKFQNIFILNEIWSLKKQNKKSAEMMTPLRFFGQNGDFFFQMICHNKITPLWKKLLLTPRCDFFKKSRKMISVRVFLIYKKVFEHLF